MFISFYILFHISTWPTWESFFTILILIWNASSADEVLSWFPADISRWIYKITFAKSKTFNVKFHAFSTILSSWWSTVTIATCALGLKPTTAIKFPCCTKFGYFAEFLQVNFVFRDYFIGFTNRLWIEI